MRSQRRFFEKSRAIIISSKAINRELAGAGDISEFIPHACTVVVYLLRLREDFPPCAHEAESIDAYVLIIILSRAIYGAFG